MRNIIWMMKYNSLAIKSKQEIKVYQEEIKKLLLENDDLKIDNEDLHSKMALKNKQIRELRETLKGRK